jgi:hypothetical protein
VARLWQFLFVQRQPSWNNNVSIQSKNRNIIENTWSKLFRTPSRYLLNEFSSELWARCLFKLFSCLFKKQTNVGLNRNRSMLTFLQMLIILHNPFAFLIMLS